MVLHLFDTVEVIPPKPFRAHSPVVSLDIGVLLRLSRLDIEQSDPGVLRPSLEPAADVFGAVIHTNGQRLPTPCDDLVEGTDNAFGR